MDADHLTALYPLQKLDGTQVNQLMQDLSLQDKTSLSLESQRLWQEILQISENELSSLDISLRTLIREISLSSTSCTKAKQAISSFVDPKTSKLIIAAIEANSSEWKTQSIMHRIGSSKLIDFEWNLINPHPSRVYARSSVCVTLKLQRHHVFPIETLELSFDESDFAVFLDRLRSIRSGMNKFAS